MGCHYGSIPYIKTTFRSSLLRFCSVCSTSSIADRLLGFVTVSRRFAVVQITYKGSGNVRNIEVVISWPYELQSMYESGKHLLYLAQLPQASYIAPYQIGLGLNKSPPALYLQSATNSLVTAEHLAVAACCLQYE